MPISKKQLFYEDSFEGLRCAEYSNWNMGVVIISPRESIDKLLSLDEVKRFGVYLLLSEDKVYVGQAMDLANRIKSHMVNKDWWTEVVILTTSDDSLTQSDISYLEYYLIEKAKAGNQLDSENKQKGHIPKVDKFTKPKLDAYLKGALFALDGEGITVFKERTASAPVGVTNEEVFYFKFNGSMPGRSADARMRVKDGKCILLKGSKVALAPTTSCGDTVHNNRERYEDLVDDRGILQADIVFSTPSGAGGFVYYGNRSGNLSWKTADGVTYADWLAAQAPEE